MVGRSRIDAAVTVDDAVVEPDVIRHVFLSREERVAKGLKSQVVYRITIGTSSSISQESQARG